MLSRLVDILLVESLRLTPAPDASAGLLRGLGDVRLAEAIRKIHADPGRSWTMAQLAKEAALSRSAFFDRFTRNVGNADGTSERRMAPKYAWLREYAIAISTEALIRSVTFSTDTAAGL